MDLNKDSGAEEKLKTARKRQGRPLQRYGISVAAVIAAAAIRAALSQSLGTGTPFITFYPAVMFAALYGGLPTGLLATALSAILANYLWMGRLSTQYVVDWPATTVLLFSCLMVSGITEAMHRARKRAQAAEDELKFVAERKRMEEELRESEERYREFFELSAVGMGQADPATRRFTEVNDRMCRITGYSREELLAMTVQDLTHPDDREEDWKEFSRMLRAEIPEYSNEKRYVHKDGHEVWVHVAARAIRDESGNPLRSIAVILDITERKELERARADFVSMLTHDLKSPLTTIVGYADLLRDRDLDKGAAEMVESIRHSGDRMMRMVEDYLTVSKFKSGAFQVSPMPEYLGHVLERLATDFTPAAELKGIRLETEIAADIPAACVDLKYFERSVGNLVQNAINYTQPGGRVLLKVETGAREGGRRNGRYIAVSVVDNGPGMPESEKDKVCDKYYTRQKGMKGTGLGLAIVKAVAEAHGGRATVDSKPGKGSAFHIYLPLKADC